MRIVVYVVISSRYSCQSTLHNAIILHGASFERFKHINLVSTYNKIKENGKGIE